MTVSLAHEVERAVASGNPEARRAMLRRMTDLFVDNAEHLQESQVSTFDAVILKLAESVESGARAALAASLAGVTNAPRDVVRNLAYDTEIAVAGPILSGSSRVAEGDLVRIAEEHDQAHLFALSRRRSLSERVTDVLVLRGDSEVVRSVAGNGGARFSTKGFDTLAGRAEEDTSLGDVLKLRHDVPPEHMARLVAAAKAAVSRKLEAEFGAQAVSAAVSEATRSLAADGPSLYEAVAAVDGYLKRQGVSLPDEAIVAAWLAEGRIMEALVGIARAAGTPPDLVLHAFQGTHNDPVLFIVRSARFGRGTLKALMTAKVGKEPDPAEMNGIFEAFQALSVPTAQRVVRFAATRDQLLKAS